MITIIAGSRTVRDLAEVERAIVASGFRVTRVLSGCAKGPDTLAVAWAAEHDIPVHWFPPAWQTLGRAAGMIRNIEMAKNAEALIAVWDGESAGTAHMIETARKHGLQVYIHRVGAPVVPPQGELAL